jgi:hypothetical protein
MEKSGNKLGRPPLYKTPDELQEKIDQYFKDGYKTKTIHLKDGTEVEIPCITISDLVIYLGFCDRVSFYDYEKRPDFSYTIKRARSFIEREYEEMLRFGNPTGAIFALKNFGWSDKQEIDHRSADGSMSPTRIEIVAPE